MSRRSTALAAPPRRTLVRRLYDGVMGGARAMLDRLRPGPRRHRSVAWATSYVNQASLRATWNNWGVGVRRLQEPYKNSSWVYICVSRNAMAAAAVPWRVASRKGGQWSPDPMHPLNDLLLDGANIAWSWQ